MKQEEKILTREVVEELGFDKLDVITSDMLDGYTKIGDYAFAWCNSITSVTLPNSVTSIGNNAFSSCSSLTTITIQNSVTSIGYSAFEYCSSLTSIAVPDGVTRIGSSAFSNCKKLNSVTIGNKTYEIQEVTNGKCKAYKAFFADLTCRNFQYKEGKTYEIEGDIILCKHGFHACLNLKDVFNYYYCELGKNVVVHEVKLEGVSYKRNEYDSKVVAKKITIGKRIL